MEYLSLFAGIFNKNLLFETEQHMKLKTFQLQVSQKK